MLDCVAPVSAPSQMQWNMCRKLYESTLSRLWKLVKGLWQISKEGTVPTTRKLGASFTCVHSSPSFLIPNSLEYRTVYSRCELLAPSLEEIKQVLISNSVLTCLRATEKSDVNQLALFNIIWNFRTRKYIGLRHYFFFKNYNIIIFPLYFSSLHTFLCNIPTLLENHGLFLFLFFPIVITCICIYIYIQSI